MACQPIYASRAGILLLPARPVPGLIEEPVGVVDKGDSQASGTPAIFLTWQLAVDRIDQVEFPFVVREVFREPFDLDQRTAQVAARVAIKHPRM